jgi:hypothetical protein
MLVALADDVDPARAGMQVQALPGQRDQLVDAQSGIEQHDIASAIGPSFGVVDDPSALDIRKAFRGERLPAIVLDSSLNRSFAQKGSLSPLPAPRGAKRRLAPESNAGTVARMDDCEPNVPAVPTDPRKGDILFRGDLPDGWEHNAVLNSLIDRDRYAYSEGYRRGARLLVQYVVDNHLDQDFLVYPIAFLDRHHVEVVLKDTLRRASCSWRGAPGVMACAWRSQCGGPARRGRRL